MARYRKIDVRMWVDAKFRALSEQGKLLWIYLLTNPETTSLPGLYRGRESGMAEDLGWSLEAFRKAFREAFQQGMVEADWKAGLIWVPNVVRHNPPESPNVVKSWVHLVDELPECAMKVRAISTLRAFGEGLGEGFQKAFREAFPIPLAKGMPNQEQEQEQEQDLPPTPQGVEVPLIPAAPSFRVTAKDLDAVYQAYPRKEGKTKGMVIAQREIKTQADLEDLRSAISKYADHWRHREDREYIQHFSTFMKEWKDWLPTDEDREQARLKDIATARLAERVRLAEEDGSAFERRRVET